MIEEHRLEIKRQARYFKLGEQKQAKHLIFVLHGYGQLPQYFLRKFLPLQASHRLLVAPEGLHRFYLSGSKGRVGSSWMTKEDRQQDIEDYVAYLDQLARQLASQHFERVTILGFSQGVATACRWAVLGETPFDVLVNWAGAFPPDLDFTKAYDRLQAKHLFLALGDQDEYASEEDFQKQVSFLGQQGLQPRIKRFEGGHDLHQHTLEQLMREIERL